MIDDPKNKKKVPTCHRTITKSIFDDLDYKYVIKNSVGEALELYKKEAKEIDKIQKRILEISKKEEPYDIFICYKETDENKERTHDSVIAEDIYDKLTEEGYKVFFSKITLEDKLGTEYEPYIYSALKTSKVMLVVGTSEENFNAVWVKNEWSRYLEFMKEDKNKVMIPVYSKIDAYKLPESFANLQAQNMDKIGAMQDLIKGIKKIINETKNTSVTNKDIENLKKVMDEASNVGNGKYEVVKMKEKLPTSYYILLVLIILSVIMLTLLNSLIFASLSDQNIKKGFSLFLFSNFITILGCILCSSGRKEYRYGKYLFLISLVCNILFCLVYKYSFGSLGWKSYFITSNILFEFVFNIMLFLINPKWSIDSSTKLVLNKKEKEKQDKLNNEIIQNFREKEKLFFKK